MVLAIACAITIGGAFSAFAYWRNRQTALAALIVLHEAQGEHVGPARERYWKLDRSAKYIAIVNMACWAITTIGLSLVDQHAELIPWGWTRGLIVAIPTLAMWAMVIIATIYNDRESTQRSRLWERFDRRWK